MELINIFTENELCNINIDNTDDEFWKKQFHWDMYSQAFSDKYKQQY